MALLGATGTPTGGRRTEKHFPCLILGVMGMGLVSNATQGEQELQGGLTPCLSPPASVLPGCCGDGVSCAQPSLSPLRGFRAASHPYKRSYPTRGTCLTSVKAEEVAETPAGRPSPCPGTRGAGLERNPQCAGCTLRGRCFCQSFSIFRGFLCRTSHQLMSQCHPKNGATAPRPRQRVSARLGVHESISLCSFARGWAARFLPFLPVPKPRTGCSGPKLRAGLPFCPRTPFGLKGGEIRTSRPSLKCFIWRKVTKLVKPRVLGGCPVGLGGQQEGADRCPLSCRSQLCG